MQLATLCYVKHNNKTLMLHRIKKKNDVHQNKWNGLGGKFDQGETPEQCAIREVKEEAGLTVKNPELKGFLTFPMFDKQKDWYVFVFVFREFSGNLIECKEGDLKWILDSKLLKLNLWGGDYIFLPWLEQNKIFSAKFIYDKGKLKDYNVIFYG